MYSYYKEQCYSDADAIYRYGGGEGPIHYAGFHCTGDETGLANCTVTQDGRVQVVSGCLHFEDAGVVCANSKPIIYVDRSIKPLITQNLAI